MEHYSLHKLKDMIYAELDRIAMSSEFTSKTLCQVESLTHSLKNILKIEKINKELDSEISSNQAMLSEK